MWGLRTIRALGGLGAHNQCCILGEGVDVCVVLRFVVADAVKGFQEGGDFVGGVGGERGGGGYVVGHFGGFDSELCY